MTYLLTMTRSSGAADEPLDLGGERIADLSWARDLAPSMGEPVPDPTVINRVTPT